MSSAARMIAEAPPASVPIIPRGGRFQWDLPLAPKAAYRFLGYKVSGVPHVAYPWHAEDVKLIRSYYDPGFIPVFRRMDYQTLAGAVISFFHHGVARKALDCPPDPKVVAIDMPSGCSFERPTIIERWFENKDHVRAYSIRSMYALPPPFIPWSAWVVTWAAETFWGASIREKQLYREAEEAKRQAALDREVDFQVAEAEYVDKAEFNHRKSLYDSMGPADDREILARQTGQWEEEKKITVDYGGGRKQAGGEIREAGHGG